MAAPLLIAIATRLVVRYGSVQVQRVLVSRGTLAAVRGNLAGGLFGSQSVLGSLIRLQGRDAIKNELIRIGERGLTAQILSELSHRTNLAGDPQSPLQAFRDVTELDRDLATMRGRAHLARRAAIGVMAEKWGRHVEAIAPRDSDRYLAGWQDALTKAGIEGFELEEVNVSEFAEQLQASLIEQLRYWERQAAKHQRRGQSQTPFGREAQSIAQQSRDMISRLGNANSVVESFRRGERNELILDIVARAPVGGEGRIRSSDSEIEIELVNLEAHASEVERRDRIAQRAEELLSEEDRREVQRAYMEEITKGTGLAYTPN